MAWISFAGSGTPANPSVPFEFQGRNTDGLGTSVAAGTPANTKGSFVSLGSAFSNDCFGYTLFITTSSAGAARFLVDVSHDNGSTTKISNIYCQPTTSPPAIMLRIPLALAAADQIALKIQSSTASATLKAYVAGWVESADTPPGYTTATQLISADTTNTRASATSVAMAGDATTYTELVASTAAEYNAFLVSLSDNGTMGTAQQYAARLGFGAAASETPYNHMIGSSATSVALLPRANMPLLERTIAASSRLSLNVQAAATGDSVLAQVLAFT